MLMTKRILTIVSMLGILVGFDFIVQHWPYGKQIFLVSYVLLLITFFIKKPKKTDQ